MLLRHWQTLRLLLVTVQFLWYQLVEPTEDAIEFWGGNAKKWRMTQGEISYQLLMVSMILDPLLIK